LELTLREQNCPKCCKTESQLDKKTQVYLRHLFYLHYYVQCFKERVKERDKEKERERERERERENKREIKKTQFKTLKLVEHKKVSRFDLCDNKLIFFEYS
jgi:hypothetical protein